MLEFFSKGESSFSKRPAVKLDFPHFNGEDPEGWLYQADEYLAYHGILDESKLQIVGFHMTGKALSWIRGLRRNKLLTTWREFVDDLRERFWKAEYENKLEELSRLQQTIMLESYLDKFEDLMNEVEGQSEATLVTYFVGGLRPDLKSELKIMKPTTLQQAFSAARVYEAHLGQRQMGIGVKESSSGWKRNTDV